MNVIVSGLPENHNNVPLLSMDLPSQERTMEFTDCHLAMTARTNVLSQAQAKVRGTILLQPFRPIFKKHRIRKFWIKEPVPMRGSSLKSTVIVFDTPDDAFVAARLIDGFVYKTEQEKKFCLTARVDKSVRRDRPVSPRNHDRREIMRERENRFRERGDRHSRRNSRERSRSPQSSSSQLDLEIEMLKKQRMIVEEERRIVLEKKKLHLAKEIGPTVLNEFQFEEPREYRGRRSRPEREPRPGRPWPLQIRDPPTHLTITKQITSAPYAPKLPLFAMPCRLLAEEMRPAMLKHASNEEFDLLMEILNATLRKRIAVALHKKPHMSGVEIVKLYRELYPASTDEDLIKTHLKDLKMFYMPVKKDTKKDDKDADKSTVKKEITEENESTNEEMADVKEETKTKKKFTEVKKKVTVVKSKGSEAKKQVVAKNKEGKAKNEQTVIAKTSKVTDEGKEISDDGKGIDTEKGNLKQEDDESRNDHENVDSDTVAAATDKEADIDEEEKGKADNNKIIETKIKIVNKSVKFDKTKEKEIIVKDVIKVKKAIEAVGKPKSKLEKVNKGIKGLTKASKVVKTKDAEDDETEGENLGKTYLDATEIASAMDDDQEEGFNKGIKGLTKASKVVKTKDAEDDETEGENLGKTSLDATEIASAMDDDHEEGFGGEEDWNTEEPDDADSMDI